MIRSMTGKVLAAFMTAAMLMPCALQAQTAEKVLESHFNAIGLKKLEEVKTATTTGAISIMGTDAPITIFYKHPGKVRTEITVMGMNIISLSNGKVGYQVVPGQPVKEVTGDELKDMTKRTGISDELYEAQKEKSKFAMAGKTTLNDKEVLKMSIIDPHGDSSYAYIDPKTYYVVKIEATKTMGGQTAQLEVAYSDFKAVDGITLPFSIATNVMGQSANMKLDKVVFNAAIDDNQFEKPKE